MPSRKKDQGGGDLKTTALPPKDCVSALSVSLELHVSNGSGNRDLTALFIEPLQKLNGNASESSLSNCVVAKIIFP